MTTVLSVSSVLLVVLILIRHIESAYLGRRYLELLRRKLDRVTYTTATFVRYILKVIIEFIHKDVFLYVIHLVMYIALQSVRYVEKWLERITIFIRSFRRKKRKTTSSQKLHSIKRESSSEDKFKQNM